MSPITKMIGYKISINIAAHPFFSIITYINPIANDKDGPIATIFAIPQMMYFRFLDFPLLKNIAMTATKKNMNNAVTMAISHHLSQDKL